MGLISTFRNGLSLVATAIAAAILGSSVLPEAVNDPALTDALPGRASNGGHWPKNYGAGSRSHRRWARARASGRHDFRRTLAKG